MKKIDQVIKKTIRPEKVIQFGEGGFLRGFADWMLQKLNDSGLFCGSVVVVQPIEQGLCAKLSEQNCIYTHVMRGLEDGKPTVTQDAIDVISRCCEPYKDFQAFLSLADDPSFRFVVSNTTESGIAYHPGDALTDTPPVSFPAKLTCLLYRRYQNQMDGFVFLPCELIDQNGKKLKEIILHYASDWKLEEGFVKWLEEKNIFCNTLVDRIVTGHPTENLDLPYEDKMANTSELFHLWVIEGPASVQEELPFDRAGLHVVWTNQLERYRTRKVRILNGAHTSFVAYAMLRGFETVGDCINDSKMASFIKHCIYDEIIPTLDLPKAELTEYADSVLERFANPFICHKLSSIALNSISKFKVRVLPSILEYQKRYGSYPSHLLKGFAALLEFYQTDMAMDAPEIIAAIKNRTLDEILSNTELWGQDLSCLKKEVLPFVNSSEG